MSVNRFRFCGEGFGSGKCAVPEPIFKRWASCRPYLRMLRPRSSEGGTLMGRIFLKDILFAAAILAVLYAIPDAFAGREIVRFVLLGLLALAFFPRALTYFLTITSYGWSSYSGWAINIVAPAVAIFSSLFCSIFFDSTLAIVIAGAAGYDAVCWVYFFCIGWKGLRDNDPVVKALDDLGKLD
jgi:hypothetical protein